MQPISSVQGGYSSPDEKRIPVSASLTEPRFGQVHRDGEAVLSPDTDAQKVKLRNAARDFEAIFIRQILSSMHSTLDSGGMFGEGMAGSIYSDMMNTAIADKAAERGDMGLADILYRRMVKFIDPSEADTTLVNLDLNTKD